MIVERDARVTGLNVANLFAALKRVPSEVSEFAVARCDFVAGGAMHGVCVRRDAMREWAIIVWDLPSREAEEVQTDWAHEIGHAWRQSRGEALDESPARASDDEVEEEERKVRLLAASWGFAGEAARP